MVEGRAVKISFKAKMLNAREDAIIQTVNRLLCAKGFDSMTVDEVAAAVGIAKASLYKHFPSKEHLAAAALVAATQRALAFLQTLPAAQPPLQQLQAVVRWALQLKLAGEMPALPSQNSSLRTALMADKAYMNGLLELSDRLGAWIEQAQADGSLDATLPPIAVLYTLYARACDPVVEFLQLGGQHSDEEIVQFVMHTCFAGLESRATAAARA